MAYADKERQREYQRTWMARRREKFLANGRCKCGAKEDLNVHHLDPAQKVSHRIWSWSEARIIEELEKCVVMCEPCHVSLHAAQKRVDHGVPGYKRGCRCSTCKMAKSIENKRYRKR